MRYIDDMFWFFASLLGKRIADTRSFYYYKFILDGHIPKIGLVLRLISPSRPSKKPNEKNISLPIENPSSYYIK